MSYLTPLSTIEFNLKQSKEDSEKGSDQFSLSPFKVKKLPKWLIEFDSFSINDCKFKNESNTRPLTESSVSQKPQWFKELVQQRRSSETFASVEPNSDLLKSESSSETLDIIDFDDTTKKQSRNKLNRRSLTDLPLNPLNDQNLSKNIVSLPRQIETYFEPLLNEPLLDEPLLNTRNSRNSIRSRENLMLGTDDDYVDFIIPELPFGRELVFEIITNWGDEDFVGLNGIEILDLNGTDLKIEKIWSEPESNNLNVLIDGIYRTHDDSHIWLRQLEDKKQLPLKIGIRFESQISVALIRIWNYNKSRIYSYRGVKFITIKFDNKLIFKGEIAKASGDLIGSIEAFGDTILFTTDETILEELALRDVSFQELVNEIFPLTQE